MCAYPKPKLSISEAFYYSKAIKSPKWWNAVGIYFFNSYPVSSCCSLPSWLSRLFRQFLPSHVSKRVFKDHVRIHFSFQMKPQIRSREKGTRREAGKKSGGNVVSGSINHLFCLLLRILNVPCLWCRSSAAKWKSTRSYIHPRQVYVPQNWRVKKERAEQRFSEQNNQIALIWQSLVHDLSSAGRIISC